MYNFNQLPADFEFASVRRINIFQALKIEFYRVKILIFK